MLILACVMGGALFCGLVGGAIAGARGGEPMCGFIIGMLLGPVGVVLAFFVGEEDDRRPDRAPPDVPHRAG